MIKIAKSADQSSKSAMTISALLIVAALLVSGSFGFTRHSRPCRPEKS